MSWIKRMRLVSAFATIATVTLMGPPSFPLSEALAQDNPRFIPLGRVPTLLVPGGDRPPKFRRGSTQVNVFVDPATLENSINRPLSNACAQGQFNMATPYYYVRLETERGPRRFGYANANFNLRDPKSQAGPDTAYLFERDRTSECRVYAIATRL